MHDDRRSRTLLTLAVSALLVCAGTAIAQEAGQGAQELPAGMTPEMMAAWEKAMTPGPEHERLAALAGSWTFTGTSWMAPDAPPEKTEGSAEREMIHGGRVLVERVKAEMMGSPFEGFGTTGYDNVAGKYWGTWTDSMGTGLMLSEGTCSEDGSCEFTGTWNDPILGGPKTVRMTSTPTETGEIMAIYDKTSDGTEFKSMELTYKRAD